jgi:LysM repeat protein
MNMDSGSSLGSYVVTGLAIVGIALGGSALYVSMNGRSGVAQQNDRISEVEQKVDRLGGATDELQGQIRGLYNQTRTQLDGLANQLNTLRESAKPATPTAPAASSVESAVGGQAAPPVPPSEGATSYTVRAGDYPAKIAKEHGITVAALMKANPGLRPEKLKVGQSIKLP